MIRWIRLDERSWETIDTVNGKQMGDAVFELSGDAQTLTVRQKTDAGAPATYRRTSPERQGLAGVWSLRTTQAPTMELAVADGYDLIYSSGGAQCKARFDGRDYPVFGPDGKPTGLETCRIAKAGARGFSMTLKLNGKPFSVDTYTVSEDGRTLTGAGGPKGQPHRLVHQRQ